MGDNGFKGVTMITNTLCVVCDDDRNLVYLGEIDPASGSIDLRAIAGQKNKSGVRDADDGQDARFAQCFAPVYDHQRKVLYVADKAGGTIRSIGCTPDAATGKYRYPVTTIADFSDMADVPKIVALYLTLDGRTLYGVEQGDGPIVAVDLETGQTHLPWSNANKTLYTPHDGTNYLLTSWTSPQDTVTVGAAPSCGCAGSTALAQFRLTDPDTGLSVYANQDFFWISDQGDDKQGPMYIYGIQAQRPDCIVRMRNASGGKSWVGQAVHQVTPNIFISMNRGSEGTGLWAYTNAASAEGSWRCYGDGNKTRFACGCAPLQQEKNAKSDDFEYGECKKLVSGKKYDSPHGFALAPSRRAGLLADTGESGGGKLFYVTWDFAFDGGATQPTRLSNADQVKLSQDKSGISDGFSASYWAQVEIRALQIQPL